MRRYMQWGPPEPLCKVAYDAFPGIEPGYLSWYSDSLWAESYGDRIRVWTRFSGPFQTGPGADPASYTMGTGSLTGVKPTGHGADHPLPSSDEVKEREELYIYAFSGPS
jgi:hypothetical protein